MPSKYCQGLPKIGQRDYDIFRKQKEGDMVNERFFSLPVEKQQTIINAGYRVFSRDSYKSSSMREIAEAAGISKIGRAHV